MSNNISNKDVLQLIFNEQWEYAHVTSFPDDPGKISQARKGICWAGDNYYRQPLVAGENQFFCVSLFTHDPERSRRRKSNFVATYVIGLDDVMEKLPPDQVARLPTPTYKQKTSMYSEQWFYVLVQPETNRLRVDNLMDQLIENGLAPDGNDPGMKGVTRYLRLPEGSNTKAKRIEENFGLPFKCQITEWNPHLKYTMEQLAEPFNVDLDAERADDRAGAAAEVEDHPLLSRLNIKERLSPGRYDITCPWVHDHTGQEDSGTAIFTNHDGTAGFQCHHGHCQGRTLGDVLDYLNSREPGFKGQYYSWQTLYSFKNVTGTPTPAPTQPKIKFDFMQAPQVDANQPKEEPLPKLVDYQKMLDDLRREMPNTDEKLQKCNEFLRVIDPLKHAEKLRWWDQVQHIMGWSKTDLDKVIKSYQSDWYNEENIELLKDVYYISSMNQFYHIKKKMFYTPESFRNSYIHIDDDVYARLVKDADNIIDNADYAPGLPQFFNVGPVSYLNMFENSFNYGRMGGDPSPWLGHWDQLGWTPFRDTHLKFMAYTLRQPEKKINWACVLGGNEGVGKDFLLYPLTMALGDHSGIAEGLDLESDFNEYLMHVKHIHFNEIELGNHLHSKSIANKLKPIIAAPPDTLNINVKNMRRLKVRNIVNVTIATNNYQFLHVDSNARRYFMTWTDLQTRDSTGNVKPEWVSYWQRMWNWMLDESKGGQGGWRDCVYYLTNHVDLSNFNAQSAPEVTDYMKEVQAMSRSSLENDVRDFIRTGVGPFAKDILSIDEAISAIKFHADSYNGNVTKVIVKKVLQQAGCDITAKMVLSNGQARDAVVIRNTERYKALSQIQMGYEYEKQTKRATAENGGGVISLVGR